MFKKLSAFLILCLFSGFALAGLFDKKPTFLKSEEAFALTTQHQANELQLHWQIADGYYLYQKEVKVSGQDVKLGEIHFPQTESYQDEFFGEVEIYRNQLQLNVPFSEANEKSQVEIRYQGCTHGFCYPPETISVSLSGNSQPMQAVNSVEKIANTNAPQAEQNQLADNLAKNQLAVFWFFLLGVGLAFTPCVLPMLPLLSAIVIGQKDRPNSLRALLLSFSYVQGMAVTYTLLGLLVAAIGLPFQIALQSPAVLIALSVLFTLLAASMFGLFEIRLPNSWQQKLNSLSQKQSGGAFGGVFVMGMIAGLVASPCTSAPLSGALLYVAQNGDLFTGGLALYLLALGMGTPLVLITLFGNKILPKSGDWLLKVKTAFGFVMLALPVFLLSRILPAHYEALMWSALAMVFLGWLISVIPAQGLFKQAVRIGLFFAFAVSAYPVGQLIWQAPQTQQHETTHVTFEKVSSLAELNEKLATAKGKKVMLDLYADWCVACKEFEKYTFSDAAVQRKLAEMVVLQMDMTKNSAENSALMQHFRILGLPTILFFDENGNEQTNARITGFLEASAFLNWLNQH